MKANIDAALGGENIDAALKEKGNLLKTRIEEIFSPENLNAEALKNNLDNLFKSIGSKGDLSGIIGKGKLLENTGFIH
jgi:hypothetical protein